PDARPLAPSSLVLDNLQRPRIATPEQLLTDPKRQQRNEDIERLITSLDDLATINEQRAVLGENAITLRDKDFSLLMVFYGKKGLLLQPDEDTVVISFLDKHNIIGSRRDIVLSNLHNLRNNETRTKESQQKNTGLTTHSKLAATVQKAL